MAPAFADDLPKIGLGIIVFIYQLLISQRLLDGIEVCALNVLDNCDF